ncbi:MAG: CDF family Co(II)/Ni(II) efflux transporter DmeF [Alphaproteobacteria bacterium]|nr:CDF family Co(II)/Ni(II) efflux transporter DmeF [Alphaproteobacteria bacterium]
MAVFRELTEPAHLHDYLGAAHDTNARRTRWVVALTAVMMVGEIVAGYLTGSMALLADGFHMATHAGALTVAAFAYAYAKRYAHDPRFTFGTGKVGELAGFASAFALALIAIGIGVVSAIRLARPIPVNFSDATLIAVLGLIVNLVSAALLAGGGHHHGHAHHKHHDWAGHDHGGHGHDNNLRAAYVHVLADALTSVLAIIGLLAGRYLGWVWLDPLMGMVAAAVIGRWSWGLMGDTARVLLDTADPHLFEEVLECVEKPGDARVVDLHVWQVGPQAHAASVVVRGPIDAEAVRDRLKPVHEIKHLTAEVA